MIKVWQQDRDTKQWKVVTHECMYCHRVIKSPTLMAEHDEKCRRINNINKETYMPIQSVMRGGKKYYRWGDTGKLYEKREDAEKQARAAYASGYREKKENK